MTDTCWALASLGCVSLVAWLWLALMRGMFWRADIRLPRGGERTPPGWRWPTVAVIVPARNEAATLPETLPTLLAQRYGGDLTVTVVDDGSGDGTADVARSIGAASPGGGRLTVLAGRDLPAGWSGKLWALRTGIEAAARSGPEMLLLTDADIAHPPDGVRRLVERAAASGSDLVSLMALLRLDTAFDRLLLPAFVYFFAKLYPFAWSNRPGSRTAAAAGGCVLIRRRALERAGGLEAISGALIDDCSLAAAVKRSGGRTWLGLSTRVRSVRAYGSVGSVWDMVARTAYTQLGHSPAALAGTVAGMALLYGAPVLSAAAGLWLVASAGPACGMVALGAGACGWAAMAATFRPMLRLYGVGALAAPSLPAAGALFTVFTVASAVRRWRGGAGSWRGRELPSRP